MPDGEPPRLECVVDRRRKRRLGGKSVLDRQHGDAGAISDETDRSVVSRSAAEHEAAAVQEDDHFAFALLVVMDALGQARDLANVEVFAFRNGGWGAGGGLHGYALQEKKWN